MNKTQELQHLSLATTYELDNTFDSDKLIKMRLRVCHDGINPNNSVFEINDMEKAKLSITNIPILANIIFDEDGNPQFGGHDMELEKSKVSEGEYKLIYKETPIGLIPESCNHIIEEFNNKNYVFVDCYIWKEYSNYAQDIIERDKDVKLSMEIIVDGYSYNSKDKTYSITDYRYQGITFLNKDFGTGMENALATTEQFSDNNPKDKFIMMMQELKNTLSQHDINNININQEGGKEDLMDKKTELLAKYNLTLETISFSIEELSLEEIEAKITEQFALLASQKAEELSNALRAEKFTDRWGDSYSLFSYVDSTNEEVFAYDRQDNWSLCGFMYSMNGDSVIIDFESKKKKKFQIVDFEDGVTTNVFTVFPQEALDYEVASKEKELAEQFAKSNEGVETAEQIAERFATLELAKQEVQNQLDTVTTDFNTITEEFELVKPELERLKKFESDSVTKERTQAEDALFSQFDTQLTDNEEYQELKKNTSQFSLEQLEKEVAFIIVKSGANVKFTAKPKQKTQTVKLNLNTNHSEPESKPYGNLFEKYLPSQE